MTPIEALETMESEWMLGAEDDDSPPNIIRKALENAYHPDRLIIDRHELNRFNRMVTREKFNKTVVAAQKLLKEHERLKELCLDKIEGRVNCPDNWMEWNKEVSALCKESEATDDN